MLKNHLTQLMPTKTCKRTFAYLFLYGGTLHVWFFIIFQPTHSTTATFCYISSTDYLNPYRPLYLHVVDVLREIGVGGDHRSGEQEQLNG